MGLLNLAQNCAHNPETDWPDIIRNHFQIMAKSQREHQALEERLGEFGRVGELLSVRLWPESYLRELGADKIVHRRDIPGTTLGSDGRVLGYDFEIQCRSTLDNIRAVLEEAGASFDQVVDVTVFLTNMEDFPVLNRVYGEYFITNRPARTTVEVTRLPTPIAVEMKMVAWLGES